MPHTSAHNQAVKDALLETVRRMTPAQAAQFVRDLEDVSKHARATGEGEDFEDFLREGTPSPLPDQPREAYDAAFEHYFDLDEKRQLGSPTRENLLDELAYRTDGHVWCSIARLETILDAVGGEERPAYWMVAG